MQASSYSTSVGDARLPEQYRNSTTGYSLLGKLFLCMFKGITTYVHTEDGTERTGKVSLLLASATSCQSDYQVTVT